MMGFTPTIAFEFDGAICDSSPSWDGWYVIEGDVTPGITEVINHFNNCGYKTVVYSMRCQSTAGKEAVMKYLDDHGIEVDAVEGTMPQALAVVDENGIKIMCKPGELSAITSGVEPWWKSAFTMRSPTPQRLRRCTVQLDYKDENSVVEGYFHHWGVDYEEFETGPGPFTVGVVELEDGSVVQMSPRYIKFLDRRR